MTSLTRCGIGALDPTQGQAVETAFAGGAEAVTAARAAPARVAATAAARQRPGGVRCLRRAECRRKLRMVPPRARLTQRGRGDRGPRRRRLRPQKEWVPAQHKLAMSNRLDARPEKFC